MEVHAEATRRSRANGIVLGLALALATAAPAVLASTADGVTPSRETVCEVLEGRKKGLCNAYCEAMDCDSANPRASDRACEQVFDNWQSAVEADGNGEPEIPPCADVDLDGYDNAVDNCPTVYNPDQADSDQNGIGDACEIN